jgi:fructokinase
VALADIVKASEEEIEWLYPDSDREAVAMKWMDAGVQLVVMTRGARGMVALRQGESVGVAGVEVDVIDTVGAGDTVGALLVEAVLELGLEHLRGEELTKVLRRAAHAAAITCSREGANPPTLNELNESLSRINP